MMDYNTNVTIENPEIEKRVAQIRELLNQCTEISERDSESNDGNTSIAFMVLIETPDNVHSRTYARGDSMMIFGAELEKNRAMIPLVMGASEHRLMMESESDTNA